MLRFIFLAAVLLSVVSIEWLSVWALALVDVALLAGIVVFLVVKLREGYDFTNRT